MFDTDGGGSISPSEMKTVIGNNVTDEMINEIMGSVDENQEGKDKGDGTISFEEFKRMMLTLK